MKLEFKPDNFTVLLGKDRNLAAKFAQHFYDKHMEKMKKGSRVVYFNPNRKTPFGYQGYYENKEGKLPKSITHKALISECSIEKL